MKWFPAWSCCCGFRAGFWDWPMCPAKFGQRWLFCRPRSVPAWTKTLPNWFAKDFGCGAIIWAKFGHCKGYYLGQVCYFLTLVVQDTIKQGFRHIQKNCAQPFRGLLSGPSWPFLCCSPCLAQIMTPQNGICSTFFAWNMCWNTYIYVFLINQNLSKIGP